MHSIWSFLLALCLTDTGEIRGWVVNCRNRTVSKLEVCYQTYTGTGIAQAETMCTKTNSQGEFVFDQLAPGTYGVFISSDRWRTVRYRDIKIESDKSVDLFFKLTPAPNQESWCSQ